MEEAAQGMVGAEREGAELLPTLPSFRSSQFLHLRLQSKAVLESPSVA